ncbi:TonB-dependent receptor [Balneolaceae bacterium YR4-1]|uniref:TonB-dependent receptor n=1 Tax=Halalkalibaculum roseum TaxID=2709311 RepID=A0A6M1SU54_9BACT|nr:TonB-dependent receptor [Halalkalibaculum roseum]
MFLFVLISIPAVAQQRDTLKAELDPIRIEAIYSTISPANAPLSLSVYNRSVFKRNSEASLTMNKITEQLPGIWVNDRENYSLGERITIRGVGWRTSFGVRGIQVIMDGIPLTVADGQTMLNPVDPSFVNKLELIRGPASTFWGNSSGGVLHISTFQSQQESPTLSLRSTAGSYNLFKQDVQYSGSFGSHSVSAYSSYLSQNGFRDHSSVKLSRSGLKGSVDLNNKSRLEYVGAFVAMPEAKNPSSLTKEDALNSPKMANPSSITNDAGKQVYQGQLGLNYYRDSSLGFITLTGYGIYRDLTNPLPFAVIDLNRWAGGLRGTLEKSFDNLNINFGFDSKIQSDDRSEFENNTGIRGNITLEQLEQVTNQALFVTSDVELGNWKLLAGLRYDWLTFSVDSASVSQTNSRTFNALSPSIGVTYRSNTNKWFANFSTSFEAPTTTELVNSPEGGSGFNPNLEPERTLGVEIGTKGRTADNILGYELTLYRMWITDILFPYQLQANGPTFYRNQGNTIHNGIETRITLNPIDALQFNATYNYIHATFQGEDTDSGSSIEDNDVPGIPDHRLNASISYQYKSILGELTYSYVSQYFADNLNTAENNAYNTLDAKISLARPLGDRFYRLQPFLNVNNIFNERYNGSIVPNAFGNRYFEPAAGRNFQFGLSISFY